MKNSSIRILSLVFSLVIILISCLSSLSASAADPMWVYDGISDPTDYDYSFAIVGDTQKLVAHYANQLVLERGDADEINYKVNYDKHEYPANDTLVKLYDYIINNADSKNIAHVFGLGDITERNSVWEWVQNGCPYAPDEEFAIAVEQILRMKEAGLDFSLVRGNHDSWDSFNKYIGTGSASDTLNYAGLVDEVYVHPNGTVDYTNTIHYFSAGNLDYMVITLDFGASDAILKWAGERIEANPYKNVIITTHAYMYKDGTTIATNESVPPSQNKDNAVYDKTNINNGDDIWNKLISRYPNIVLAISGHEASENVVLSQWTGDNGNVVSNLLIDPQGLDKTYYNDGCAGAVAMFYLSNGGKTVDVRFWSTARNCYIKASNQFSFTVNTIDADYTVVNTGIAALPGTVSLADYDKVLELYSIYSAMSDTNKAKVIGADKLAAAYERIKELTPTERYTVTWNVDGEISTSTVSYGEIPVFNGNAYKYGYELIGWATEEGGNACKIAGATSNCTYYAVFSDVSVWDGFIPSLSVGDTADTLFEGKGTKDNPYLIQSADDLAKLSALTKGKNFGNSQTYFKQTIDIDLTAGNWQPICSDIEYTDNKWTQWYVFSANYDGQNHTVYLEEASMKFAFGLFGAINGCIENLVIDGSITSFGYTGALVSKALKGAEIVNVINKADINAIGNQVGGLVGNVDNEITITLTNCKNEGDIYSTGSFVGGLVGGGWTTVKIFDSVNTGNVTGADNVGGLVGEIWFAGETANCSNSGKITAGGVVATDNIGTSSNYAGKWIGKSNRTCTVTWVIEGKSTSVTMTYGAKLTYGGETPIKSDDANGSYVFVGWDKTPTFVMGDETYTAQFRKKIDGINITWVIDGVSTKITVEYGSMPSYEGIPTKNATDDYTYTFIGWATHEGGEVIEGELPKAVQDATYYAVFEENEIGKNDDPIVPDDPVTTPTEDEEPEKLGFFEMIWRAIVNFFKKLFGIK